MNFLQNNKYGVLVLFSLAFMMTSCNKNNPMEDIHDALQEYSKIANEASEDRVLDSIEIALIDEKAQEVNTLFHEQQKISRENPEASEMMGKYVEENWNKISTIRNEANAAYWKLQKCEGA